MTFPVDQRFLVVDYESYSEAPLKSVGSWEYSVHPSTDILCVAWTIGTREALRAGNCPVHHWCPELREGSVQPLLAAFRNPDVILTAHNAGFEQAITKNVLARKCHTQDYLREIPVERWLCTASMASAMALPRSLGGAAKALQLPVQKDMEGKKVLDRLCKPKRPSKKDPSTRDRDPGKLARLVEYCKTDVATEVALFCALPFLSDAERDVWILDQKINLRGFGVDRRLVRTILTMVGLETTEFDRRMAELTGGAVTSARQVAELRKWLLGRGLDIPDLAAGTVEMTLKALECGTDHSEAREALELRQAASKSSTAKYQAFEQRSRSDGRCRDNLVYHRASTGRWGGAGVQPQNLAKPTMVQAEVDSAVRDLLLGDGLDLLRLLYGEPMQVFSSLLRSMIVAPEGHMLDVADFNAIETRVLFWVAGDEPGLSAFREGRDLYREQASEVFGVPAHQIAKDSFERFIGKGLILGCGFSMGWKKFAATCEKQGQPVSDELAQAAIKAYRRAHAPVVKLWRDVETAAISAVLNPGVVFKAGRCSWVHKGRFLYCYLPSGRRLAYYGPKVAYEANPFNEDQPRAVLFHWGENSVTRKWEEERTYGGRLTENIVQAIARDLMAAAMLRIENTGEWRIVLSVHDELLAERPYYGDAPHGGGERGRIENFCALMEALPPWAKGLPVRAEGWTAARYRK